MLSQISNILSLHFLLIVDIDYIDFPVYVAALSVALFSGSNNHFDMIPHHIS
jgi:hypothetical protein